MLPVCCIAVPHGSHGSGGFGHPGHTVPVRRNVALLVDAPRMSLLLPETAAKCCSTV